MSKKKPTTSWERIAIDQITDGTRVTKFINDLHEKYDLENAPNYNLYQVSPDTDLDLGKYYLISGSESSIILQASLIKAQHDIFGNRLGYSIDFNKWFEDFSYEFKGTFNDKDKYSITSDVKPWNNPIENRPKFEFTTDDAFVWEKYNYHKIKFWKDRKKINEYIVITGTLTEIREQLINLMRNNAIVQNNNSGSKYNGEVVTFKGKPKVVLYFFEKQEDLEKGYTAIESRISFNIMDKSDDSRTSLPKLTNSDIKQIAVNIQNIFAKPQPYKIHRGKETVSIKDRERGYESYIHVYNITDGIDLYRNICQVQGHIIDLRKVFHKTTVDDVNAYPIIPEQMEVLGHTVKEPRKRPVGWVHFSEAKLFISLLDTPIKLCDAKGFLFSGVDLPSK